MQHYVLDSSHAGAGDTVTAAWLAAGADLTDHTRIWLHPGRHERLARSLGARIASRPRPDGGRCVHLGLPGRVYPHQIGLGGGVRPITETWQDVMPFRVRAARPAVVLEDDARHWAMDYRDRRPDAVQGRPMALLFPRCCYGPRNWPQAHWIRLAWVLREMGYDAVALDSRPDTLLDFPSRVYGQPWPRIMALMQLADCVVANESGPAHVAGTLEAPTFVILGPTRFEANMAYLGGSVHGIHVSPDRVACVGCHFSRHRGFSGACSHGCEALHALTVAEVAQEVRKWRLRDYCPGLGATPLPISMTW